jgi:protein SCO1/2
MRRLCFLLLLAWLPLAGCHAGKPASTAANGQFKVYHLRGKVVSASPKTGEVTVDHEAIPGFMDAMTMPYKLKDPGVLSELHPGDVITADVLVSQSDDAEILLDHIVVVAQARPDYRPTSQYHVPAPGDTVPDFALRNEDGRALKFSQFHGRQLLITFIYTRCPLPNYCPLVTRNFAKIERQLAADPRLYAKTHLMSISFDPAYDTPARLKLYGEGYIGGDAKKVFPHWDFAVAEKPVVAEMAKFFDVGISDAGDGTINHTLSTTLIGADGKVVAFYHGNEWTPEQVLTDMRRTAGS